MYHPPYDSRYHTLKFKYEPPSGTSILAVMDEWSKQNPTIPCSTCRSQGSVAGKDGQFHNCLDCKGLGRRFVTDKQIRVAYGKLQKRTCEERGFSFATFNEKARRIMKEENPLSWYWAARKIAESFGVEVY